MMVCPRCLDLLPTHSTHQSVEPRAAMLQKRDAGKLPSGEVEDPFTSAATASSLSTHSTHVRDWFGGQVRGMQSMRMAAHSQNRKTGDSDSD